MVWFVCVLIFFDIIIFVSGFKVTEVYSKEMKGVISALASIQGYLLVASGPKVILHKWIGSELSGVAFFDAPPLYVVSSNIVSHLLHLSIFFARFVR